MHCHPKSALKKTRGFQPRPRSPKTTQRWLIFSAGLLALLTQAGCYCTDWRWIWEDDDDYQCHYQHPPQPLDPCR